MKTFDLLSLIIFLATISLIACNKESAPPINQAKMWECHHKIKWDSLQTQKNLIGIWEWEYVGCYWNPEKANNESFRGMSIEFKPDSTLIVRLDEEITQTSNWEVVKDYGELFALKADPSVIHLNGRILFCDNIVEFNNSYVDGCDNYFKRLE